MVKLQVWSFLLLLSFFLFDCFEVITCSPLSSSSKRVGQHLCISDEKAALLQFKGSLVVLDASDATCRSYNNISKIQSWKDIGANSTAGDCCSWEGVECDVLTGHVIGLDLYCSQLYGTIPSDSSLFKLSHLRKLYLTFNNFNGSSISSAFGLNFPQLTDLDLSDSNFSGSIPSEIAHLSKLISLTIVSSYTYQLRMEPEAFNMLIKNQTQLESLYFYGVNISSSIPEYIGNLSSLSKIYLPYCDLYGELPNSMFQLPNLQQLELPGNGGLVGHLPKSNWNCSSSLSSLDLSDVKFSSELPDSCSPGCLTSISYLNLGHGEFFGSIPPWLGNLSEITYIVLSSNSFTGQVPATFSKLKHLEILFLDDNNLQGEIPNAFSQLTELVALGLAGNRFHGKLPHWLTNLTELIELSLQSNKLTGSIPSNISEFKKLDTLSLSNNSIGGTIPLSLFALPMRSLALDSNQIYGTIPSNLTGLHNSALETINLSNNNLSGSLGPLSFVNLKGLNFLDLSHNSLQGPLPLIPLSISYLFISHNKLVGDIPSSICNSSMLEMIDLSHNTLSGMIPKCISNFSNALSVLKLGTNRLHGTFPGNFAKENLMRSINLNSNHLEGQVPQSLANCRHLEQTK